LARVAVISDTTACIPAQLAQELGIRILPLFLVFEDQVYQDGMPGTAEDFYRTLSTAPRPPSTAAPSPGDYAQAVIRAAQDAEAVLVITVSSQFSAMYDAAVQGAFLAEKQRPGINVRVLDSGAAAMAQGFVVVEAARAAREGAGLDEVVARAEALMPRVQLLVVLDQLHQLARSGRVPRLVVWASSPLQVKPVVTFQRGVYRPVALVRTMRRAIDRLYQELERRAAGAPLHVCVHHTNVPDGAAELAERVRSGLQPRELFVTEFTQVMGAHAGQGLLGFAFYTDEP
jgi:DegV family protein with EDD domain